MPVLYYMRHIPPSISPSIAAKYFFTYSINLCITGESVLFFFQTFLHIIGNGCVNFKAYIWIIVCLFLRQHRSKILLPQQKKGLFISRNPLFLKKTTENFRGSAVQITADPLNRITRNPCLAHAFFKAFSISSITIFNALILAYFLSLDSRTCQGA